MTISIGDFAAQLGEAGLQAAKACEDYAERRLRDACTEDEEGRLIPKMRTVLIYGQEVQIPELALIAQSRIDVATMSFEFEATVDLGDEAPSMSPHVGVLKNGVQVKAAVTFKANDSVEAIELLRERANREINSVLAVRQTQSEDR